MSTLVRRMIGESMADLNTPKMIVEATREEKYWVCPHCNEEIFEKHTFIDESEQERHRGCQGVLLRPPTDWSKVAPEWRALLEPKGE